MWWRKWGAMISLVPVGFLAIAGMIALLSFTCHNLIIVETFAIIMFLVMCVWFIYTANELVCLNEKKGVWELKPDFEEKYFQEKLEELAKKKGITPEQAFIMIRHRIYREMIKVDKEEEYERFILSHAATARYLSSCIPDFKKKFDKFVREA